MLAVACDLIPKADFKFTSAAPELKELNDFEKQEGIALKHSTTEAKMPVFAVFTPAALRAVFEPATEPATAPAPVPIPCQAARASSSVVATAAP